MGQNWLYLLVKAFKNCSFSEQATNLIQFGSLYDLRNFCLELQLVKQNACLIEVRDGGRGEGEQNPILFGNCINFGLYETMKKEFTYTQLKFK